MLSMKLTALILLFITIYSTDAQVENVPVTHPVYEYLIRAEARGLIPHFSTSSFPWQRKEITEALKLIYDKSNKLNSSELSVLEEHFEEFGIKPGEKAVVFYSSSDSNQVFSSEFFHDNMKFIYHFHDSSNSVKIKPLGSVEILALNNEKETRNVTLGNLGVRLYGSLGEHFGYFLQATNGTVFGGDRNLAVEEIHKLKQNVKFADLNSDFDFSESHVIFCYDWFFASIGRETQLIGSGISQRLFVSQSAPPSDALQLGAKFSNFEYRYSHASLLATDIAKNKVGFNSEFPSKYLVTHRFSLRPEWGELSFWEGIIYSKRGIDLSYLNPISFLKSMEHALHDRDNSLMGADMTYRIFDGLQLKGSYLLDDIKFEEIGKGYWSNKNAWNIGLIYSMPLGFDLGLEYARVEPYTFTHFDSVNSYTNDEMLIGTGLLPNSDEWSFTLKYWWTISHHPLIFRLSYNRHGENEYDIDGKLIKNFGGNPLQTRRPTDSDKVSFLDGDLQKTLIFDFFASYEIIKDFHIDAKYTLRYIGGSAENIFFVIFTFVDF